MPDKLSPIVVGDCIVARMKGYKRMSKNFIVFVLK
jgi:hypothetical protein